MGTADVSSLRHGLRELLPVLVAASNAPLLDKDTRAKALSASIGVATLTPSSGGIDDFTNGGINEKDATDGRAALREAARLEPTSEEIAARVARAEEAAAAAQPSGGGGLAPAPSESTAAADDLRIALRLARRDTGPATVQAIERLLAVTEAVK